MLQCTPEATMVYIYPINNYEQVNLLLMLEKHTLGIVLNITSYY